MPTGRPAAALALLLAFAAQPAAAEDPNPCSEGTALAPGLCFSAEATLDSVAALRGGIRTGAAAIGQVRLGLTADFGRLAGLEGWSGAIGILGIYGRQPTPTRVGSLATVSNIEALSTLRLHEAWLERSLGAWGSIRFGQLAADGEFATAHGAAALVNGTFGWAAALAGALPGGGPAYPLAAPAVRLNLGRPDSGTGLRLAVFSGDPGGDYGEETNVQLANRYGTTFSTAGGIFYIAEAVTGGDSPDPDDGPRRWVLKLGGWYHTGGFDSVGTDDTGLSLASPESTGVPRRYGSNYGGYAIAEATLWRGEEGWLALFGRAFAQPQDRNAISLQLDGGLAWRGPFGRADDTLSLGVSWARIGNQSRDYDRALIAFGAIRPVRSHETLLELNYDAAVVKDRLSVRPFVQALFNPAAREPNAQRDAQTALPNALVLGLRIVATF